jgi:hypothetical protein
MFMSAGFNKICILTIAKKILHTLDPMTAASILESRTLTVLIQHRSTASSKISLCNHGFISTDN